MYFTTKVNLSCYPSLVLRAVLLVINFTTCGCLASTLPLGCNKTHEAVGSLILLILLLRTTVTITTNYS